MPRAKQKSNVIAFPTPAPATMEPRQNVPNREGDLNELLTGGKVGFRLFEVPEGYYLTNPDGRTVWRIFRTTN
jgi:hypothetical protein